MEYIVSGNSHIFGDNIDTDQIYPGRYLELTSKKDIASHCMEGVRPGFTEQLTPGDIVAAGRNFGCGSSREHGAITLKEAGIGAVIAESFARIFYRNAINLGLPVIVCKGVSQKVSENDKLSVNMTTGEIKNITRNEVYQGEGLSASIIDILKAGGIKPLFKERYSVK